MQYSGESGVLFRNFAKLLAIIVNMMIEMQQAIVGFHLDEEQHYVAELACGHQQHVRHLPPWQNRPWVLTEQGRQKKIGMFLACKTCDLQKNSL